MTITQLECFVESAKTGSFSKTGSKLFISQQTVSKQIRALEEEVGIPLFDRTNMGVVLTPAGEILVRTWTHLLMAHRSAIDKAKDTYYGEAKTIRIGIHDLLAHKDLVVHSIFSFNEKFQDLTVEYELCPAHNLADKLRNNYFQMIVTYASELDKDEMLHSTELYERSLEIGIILSKKHPKAVKKKVGFSDIEGQTVGLLSRQASLDQKRRVCDILRKNGVLDKVHIKEYSSLQNLQMAVLTGKCCTIIYENIIDGMEDKMVFHKVDMENFSQIVVCWHDEKYATKARNYAEIFNEIKKEEITK